MERTQQRYDVVVIGSGFGGTMVALSLAHALKGTGKKILILERGTWWTTPVGTVADKEVGTYDFLQKKHGQPVQFWPSMDHFKGFLDILLRCVRHDGNEDGLYDFTAFGKKGLFGRIGQENDGVMILRASGVGGGSLVYSNITIQPPDLVFDDARWPGWTRDKQKREAYYTLAREAIGFGVAYAREQQKATPDPNQVAALKAYQGLHNIATRTARLDPHFHEVTDASTGQKVRQLASAELHPTADPQNALWIDRARVFQTAASAMGADIYGNVESSISDLPPGSEPYDPGKGPANYCERQGRCNVGCLPGARYTLNKQLMLAMYGKPDGTQAPLFPDVELWPLVEVDSIVAVGGEYSIHYRQRNADDPSKSERGELIVPRVVVSAGCVGTTELLLRSRPGLPGLSPKLGEGFSTNGDYLAFMEDTDAHISLTRGPVTTSFAHMNTAAGDAGKFHTLEDQGIPKALASIIGYGVPFLHAISDGFGPRSGPILDILRLVEQRLVSTVSSYFEDSHSRSEEFWSEDEKVAKMMCVVGMGLDQADGTFTLGGDGETPLRLRRPEGKKFHEDPIYDAIRGSLAKLAKQLRKAGDGNFMNPFLSPMAEKLEAKAIVLTHPLGGSRMAASADKGVVDEHGRVFDASGAPGAVYPGLYIADASMIPTALGLNPSLTISALSLHVADTILAEMKTA
jgi:cholesterol oxidase